MMIASLPHYAAHLAPLPELPDDIAVVASYRDLAQARRKRYKRIVLAQHGIGQSYGGRHPGYPGGSGNDAVGLFLTPNEHSAQRWRRAYPRTPVAVVGCPKLDELPHRRVSRVPAPVVAVSWHMDLSLVPETRNALPWFGEAVRDLASRFTVIGHSHPRQDLSRFYERIGVEYVRDFEEVCRRADVYVCDNSSTIYEFASTGRPVVLMNSPRYRRDVDFGLRFWEAARVGINVDDPADLVGAVERALDDRLEADREEALSIVYAYRTGAAQRAADAIMEWAEVAVAA